MKEVQEQHVCETDTKKLYTKPTLTKHKTCGTSLLVLPHPLLATD